MPIPKPNKDESQKDFVSRCMGNDTMNSEYPGQEQRAAVCYSQWREEHPEDKKKEKATIETLKVEDFEDIDNDALRALRLRFLQQWEKNFQDNDAQNSKSFNRVDFINKYASVIKELKKRNMKYKGTSELDKLTLRKSMFSGVSSEHWGDVVLMKDHICIMGKAVADPKSVDYIDVLYRPFKVTSKLDIEEKLNEVVSKYGNARVGWLEENADFSGEAIPLYDLVLKAKRGPLQIKKIEGKPEEKRVFTEELYVPKSPSTAEEGMAYIVIWSDEDGPKLEEFSNRELALGRAKEAADDRTLLSFEYSYSREEKAKAPVTKLGEFKIMKVEGEEEGVDERIVTGLVYAPAQDPNNPELDAQGDYVEGAAQIEKAMYNFMEAGQRLRLMHEGWGRSDLVLLENWQVGTEDVMIRGGEQLPSGAWMMTIKVNNNDLWKEIREGKLTGFSLGGTAVGIEEEVE